MTPAKLSLRDIEAEYLKAMAEDRVYLGTCLAPLRTRTGLNVREHWAARAKRVKRERTAGHFAARSALANTDPWWTDGRRYVVTLTRIGPRTCDDDNLLGACKGFRDGVADALQVDDGDTRKVRWLYQQERGPWGVRVRIETESVPEVPRG